VRLRLEEVVGGREGCVGRLRWGRRGHRELVGPFYGGMFENL
jgi:hypothetical protein